MRSFSYTIPRTRLSSFSPGASCDLCPNKLKQKEKITKLWRRNHAKKGGHQQHVQKNHHTGPVGDQRKGIGILTQDCLFHILNHSISVFPASALRQTVEGVGNTE